MEYSEFDGNFNLLWAGKGIFGQIWSQKWELILFDYDMWRLRNEDGVK